MVRGLIYFICLFIYLFIFLFFYQDDLSYFYLFFEYISFKLYIYVLYGFHFFFSLLFAMLKEFFSWIFMIINHFMNLFEFKNIIFLLRMSNELLDIEYELIELAKTQIERENDTRFNLRGYTIFFGIKLENQYKRLMHLIKTVQVTHIDLYEKVFIYRRFGLYRNTVFTDEEEDFPYFKDSKWYSKPNKQFFLINNYYNTFNTKDFSLTMSNIEENRVERSYPAVFIGFPYYIGSFFYLFSFIFIYILTIYGFNEDLGPNNDSSIDLDSEAVGGPFIKQFDDQDGAETSIDHLKKYNTLEPFLNDLDSDELSGEEDDSQDDSLSDLLISEEHRHSDIDTWDYIEDPENYTEYKSTKMVGGGGSIYNHDKDLDFMNNLYKNIFKNIHYYNYSNSMRFDNESTHSAFWDIEDYRKLTDIEYYLSKFKDNPIANAELSDIMSVKPFDTKLNSFLVQYYLDNLYEENSKNDNFDTWMDRSSSYGGFSNVMNIKENIFNLYQKLVENPELYSQVNSVNQIESQSVYDDIEASNDITREQTKIDSFFLYFFNEFKNFSFFYPLYRFFKFIFPNELVDFLFFINSSSSFKKIFLILLNLPVLILYCLLKISIWFMLYFNKLPFYYKIFFFSLFFYVLF